MAGIPLSSGFEVNSPVPIDTRTLVSTIAERDLIPSGKRHEGLIVYVTADKSHYALKGGIANANWSNVGNTLSRYYEEYIASDGQVLFPLTKSYNQFQNRVVVEVGGVPQYSPTNFVESAVNAITFTSGVPYGVLVCITYWAEAIPLADDVQLEVTNVSSQVSTILSSLNNNIDAGMFGDTTTELPLDGGTF